MYARKAILPDAENLRALIADFSGDGTLLPRSLAEICENIRDFTVVVRGRRVDWLRRAASLRHAPGGDPLDCRVAEVQGNRRGPRCWWTRCWKRPSSIMYTASACSRASRSFLRTWDLPKPSVKNCRTKSTRIVRTVPSCMSATRWRCIAASCRSLRFFPVPRSCELRLRQPLVKLEK